MTKQQVEGDEKKFAAVCGLYCQACTLYIGTTDEPERLKAMAKRFKMTTEEVACYGCRSSKRTEYCAKCKMFKCAVERGIDFCSECEEYPCDVLKEFQSLAPHRLDLWKDLEEVKKIGYEQWLQNAKKKYSCSQCGVINSAYDLTCRKCGNEPSCDFVAKHKSEIEKIL